MVSQNVVGSRLADARDAAGFTQAEAARRLGIDAQTLSRWERTGKVKPRDVVAAAQLYGVSPEALDPATSKRVGEKVPRGTIHGEGNEKEPWSPNPALRGSIPNRAYQLAIDFCRRLERAGIPSEDVSDYERIMIDRRYAKANKRLNRELSEDDWVLLVEDAWDAIRESLSMVGKVV